MATYQTPDVYVEEISTFPPSVAEVGTAVPAFIGYTGIATSKAANDLLLKPTKIRSLKDFERYFGLPAKHALSVAVVNDAAPAAAGPGAGGGGAGAPGAGAGAGAAGAAGVTAAVPAYRVTGFTAPAKIYLLYHAVRLFFDNGGSQCYIVSVGLYQDSPAFQLTGTGSDPAKKYGLSDGLEAVALEDEPTLLVVPEAVQLSTADYTTLVQAMLAQCNRLADRFAIFDLYGGGDPEGLDDAALTAARGYFGSNGLSYGAAYYPFLKTTLTPYVVEEVTSSNVTVNLSGSGAPVASDLASLRTSDTVLYNLVKAELKERFLVLPPSAAVAGIYAAVDAARGVWKAPANVSLADVIEPVVKLDNATQDGLNVDAKAGKSVNALRAFAGKGTLVWGARTLAGNDNEWRYISVRRFFIMAEESVKKATAWSVFEPNTANTWVKVRGMIENYLIDKWRDGALAGATPKDAFFVKCGLGSTMSAQDILEGRLIVEIGMAVVRPAEFVILRFSHKLQAS